MRSFPNVYSQRDPKWTTKQLGNLKGATIGLYGCLLTCHAMKAGYYGHSITPDSLNDSYVQHNLFISGDLLSDADIHALYPDIQLVDTRDYSSAPADMSHLKDLSNDPNVTVTLELDFDHNPNDGVQTHFVELHSYDGLSLRIYDPWYGVEIDFSTSYGNNPAVTIQKIAVYKGTVPVPTPPTTPPVATVTAYSYPQAFSDLYKGLCNADITPDEAAFRLNQITSGQKKMWDIINDICGGDARFYNNWVKPKIGSLAAPNQQTEISVASDQPITPTQPQQPEIPVPSNTTIGSTVINPDIPQVVEVPDKPVNTNLLRRVLALFKFW